MAIGAMVAANRHAKRESDEALAAASLAAALICSRFIVALIFFSDLTTGEPALAGRRAVYRHYHTLLLLTTSTGCCFAVG